MCLGDADKDCEKSGRMFLELTRNIPNTKRQQCPLDCDVGYRYIRLYGIPTMINGDSPSSQDLKVPTASSRIDLRLPIDGAGREGNRLC